MGTIDDMLRNMGVIQPHDRRRFAREIRQKLARLSNFRCSNPNCRRRIAVDADDLIMQMNAGHVFAWSMGGPNSWDNLVCLCSRCNQSQGRKSPSEAFGFIGGFAVSSQALVNGVLGPLM